MSGAYYNEFDPASAAWLRELIANNLIAPGDVDERSIKDVRPDDLRGYTQHHFFSGIGLWSAALRRAGWSDDRPVWTGSCPCQPFSAAGKNEGFDDPRHLWPDWFRLIRECNPLIIFGEQVAAAGVGGRQDKNQMLHTMRGAEGIIGFPTLRGSFARRSAPSVSNVSPRLREKVENVYPGETEAPSAVAARQSADLQHRIPTEASCKVLDLSVQESLRQEQDSVRSGSTRVGNTTSDQSGILRTERLSVRHGSLSGGEGDTPRSTLVGQKKSQGGLSIEQHPSGLFRSECCDVKLGGGSSSSDNAGLGKESDLNVSRQSRSSTDHGEMLTEESVWLDLVFANLENESYACSAFDLPAAGFASGAHIRQRFYWVADRHDPQRWADLAGGHFGDWPQAGRIEGYGEFGAGGAAGGMDNTTGARHEREIEQPEIPSRDETRLRVSGAGRADGGLGFPQEQQHDGRRDEGRGGRQPSDAGDVVGMGHHHHPGSQGWRSDLVTGGSQCAVRAASLAGDVDWLLCRDGKIRPVEAGTFPLAASSPGRLAALRGYGNALDLETAVNFISAYMEAADIKAVMSELT